MERRDFIKHSAVMGVALGAVPSGAFGQWSPLKSSTLANPVLLHTVVPEIQVRHGLMQLPQPETLQSASAAFRSLSAVHRNCMLREGGSVADTDAVMDVVSLSFSSEESGTFGAVQVQCADEGWTVVTNQEMLTVPHAAIQNGLQEITLLDGAKARLWLGRLEASTGFQLESKADRYLYVLHGESMQVNGSELTAYEGHQIANSALELWAKGSAIVLALEWG